MDGTNTRVDGITRYLQKLKTSLGFTQGMFEETRKGYMVIKRKIKSFKNNIIYAKLEMEEVFTKLDCTEYQYRRSNILIDGIADEKERTGMNQRRKFNKF